MKKQPAPQELKARRWAFWCRIARILGRSGKLKLTRDAVDWSRAGSTQDVWLARSEGRVLVQVRERGQRRKPLSESEISARRITLLPEP